jgi:hypothetical protein
VSILFGIVESQKTKSFLGPNVFVAIAGTGGLASQAAYSSNGTIWTRTTMPFVAVWRAATYGNNVFVAVNSYSFSPDDNAGATSTDGITWTKVTMPGNKAAWVDVVYGNNTFVAVASSLLSTSTTDISTSSTDGITWTQRTMPASSAWQSVAYGNNTFVAIALNTAAATSTDGITWTQRTMPASTNWMPLTYSNDKFVALSRNSSIYATSTDGITWTQRTMPAGNWGSIVYGSDIYLATSYVFASQTSATSTDGITWTLRTMPENTGFYWKGLSHGNNTFVAICYNSVDQIEYTGDGKTAYSSDGISWSLAFIPDPETARWGESAYGG